MYEKYYRALDTLLDYIRRDAAGPVREDEILEEPPLETYVCGILWPKKDHKDSGQDMEEEEEAASDSGEGGGGEPEEASGEDIISETSSYKPSVMAVSFVLPAGISTVDVEFEAASYQHDTKTVDPGNGEKKRIVHSYQRQPLKMDRMTVTLGRNKEIRIAEEVYMRAAFRRKYKDGSCMWTISVENRRPHSCSNIEENCRALFQCVLKLYGPFCPLNRTISSVGGEDRRIQDLLCRDIHQYAAGHGCSVQWPEDGEVGEIRSEFLPQAAVSQMIAALPTDTYQCFRMDYWQDGTKEAALSEMREYIQSYVHWKEKLEREASGLDGAYQETAEKLIRRIALCAERLYQGAAVLENNPEAWQAFVYTNEAMKQQSAKKRKEAPEKVAWYPFQLCYVIMCIPDLVDPASQWHDTVDLLWFPTGGGKTEAYLGVAAFTIFYRRLTKREESGGVAVLMRYTLRMLTAQQFERAAALICECELLRRRNGIPGGEISIGMWVGSEVTPNHAVSENDRPESQKSAETILEALQAGEEHSVRSSPVQLSECPYCGKPLDVNTSYWIENSQFHARCSDSGCPFHDELPVITVDDDIYERRPALLISTIDKFARLAWEKKAGSIFAADGTGLPPSLLIQDELHLISGPLGSISGLYELAIDQLCTRKGIRPKIIASTATVCNAGGQIKALYGREHFQFPPSGLHREDSFFARQAAPSERPSRIYLGCYETGGSLADSLVRTFGTVSFALQYLKHTGTPNEVIDQFWTNVGYFNSLKDLGAADTLILDRVRAYAESLRLHKFSEEAKRVGMQPFELTYEHDELTSRKSAREITEVRNILDNTHYPEKGAYSYILSSNMLSVGIDISRLGLMTVYGQPKSTAEYIQATSRVGRSNPGLVIVLLQRMRARDKGHFEQFQAYHETLDRMVEPTSAAPYACRTLEKALHAVFVILVRQQIAELSRDSDAFRFRTTHQQVKMIFDSLLLRIKEQSPDTYEYAQELLSDFVDLWEDEAITKRQYLRYTVSGTSAQTTDALLIPAEKAGSGVFPPTMNSMRNVDTQSNVYLVERERRPRT